MLRLEAFSSATSLPSSWVEAAMIAATASGATERNAPRLNPSPPIIPKILGKRVKISKPTLALMPWTVMKLSPTATSSDSGARSARFRPGFFDCFIITYSLSRGGRTIGHALSGVMLGVMAPGMIRRACLDALTGRSRRAARLGLDFGFGRGEGQRRRSRGHRIDGGDRGDRGYNGGHNGRSGVDSGVR